ncbi:MAG: histidine--tRNA ligase [Gammaproteobacteria bacterium]|nr:histidine--tRNA ligase [Gammaproteobacteria bacterium]
MRDILPEEAARWREVERVIKRVIASYSYDEIRLPLLEPTDLFSRGVGEATDIVEKEMYSLLDRDGESLSLRPEGTAGCARACIQQGLIFNQVQRLWYAGSMFRYERPQKGRYRQFEQIGAEIFGIKDPAADAELIQLGTKLWRSLAIDSAVTLELNTIGSGEARKAYRDALVEYLTPRRDDLDTDSQRRLQSNPMRILDSKNEDTQKLLEGAPDLQDFIDDQARAHFAELREILDELQLPYRINRRLVRGLDYYTNTVFEWVTDALGAQGTICAGGRYDGLVQRLGGRPTPAAGFAIGIDRVVLLHEAQHLLHRGEAAEQYSKCDVYVAVMDAALMAWALRVADVLRDGVEGLAVLTHTSGGKLRNQLKRADQSGARWAIIVGEDEVEHDRISVKWLREEKPQGSMTVEEFVTTAKGAMRV